MKLIFLSISVFFTFITANAQYEKGNLDFNLGGGLGVYGVTSNDVTDTSSAVASGLIQLTANFAILDKLSLGINLERNGFITGNDSIDKDNYAYVYAYRLNIIYRLVNSEKNALSLNGSVGMSAMTYGNHKNVTTAKSDGLNFELGLNYQHLFGEHFGFYIDAAYANYKYANIIDEKGAVLKTANGSNDLELILSGGNIRLGLVYKL